MKGHMRDQKKAPPHRHPWPRIRSTDILSPRPPARKEDVQGQAA